MRTSSAKRIVKYALASLAFASLSVGLTYSLSTSGDESTVTVGTGNVSYETELVALTLYSPTSISNEGSILDSSNAASDGGFAEGGTVTYDSGSLSITGMKPGDEISFDLKVYNSSTVKTKYSYTLSDASTIEQKAEANFIGNKLTFTIDGESALYGDFLSWTEENAVTEKTLIKTVSVKIAIPSTEGEVSSSCTLSFTLNAVQGNTMTTPMRTVTLVCGKNGSEYGYFTPSSFKVPSGSTITLNTWGETLDDPATVVYDGSTISTATLTETQILASLQSYKWYYAESPVGVISQSTFLVDADVILYFYLYVGCIAEGSAVSTPMGSVSVEELSAGDEVISYDYWSGTYQPKEVMAVIENEESVLKMDVTLDNGYSITICDVEDAFDVDERKFVRLDATEPDKVLGRNLLVEQDGEEAVATVIDVKVERDVVRHYTLYVEDTNNYVAEGIVLHIPMWFENTRYVLDSDLKVDMDAYEADVATYGVYGYSDFEDVLSEYIFDALRVKDYKIAVGKGYMSYEFLKYGFGLLQEEFDDLFA